MKKKKINKRIPPQEFLASFNDEKDRKLIIESKKDIVFHLYNTALNVPTNLRQNIQKTSIILGPVAVEGEAEYKEIMNFLTIKEALIDILKQFGVIKEYKLKQRYTESVDQTYSPDDLVFADIKFYPNEAIAHFEDYQKSKEQSIFSTPKDEPKFDGVNGVIHFGNKIHSFQKGRADQKRLSLFKTLWDERMVIKNRKIKRKGRTFPAETVATRIELIDSAQVFYRAENIEKRKELRKLIKNLTTSLRRKGIPIRIKQRGGIQILVRVI